MDRLAAYARKKAFNSDRGPTNAEEEEELADIIRGIWARCWALSYKPHEKQQLFHASRAAQIRGSFSRNQGGKTTAGEMEILSWGFGEDLWTGKPIEKVGRTKWKPGMRFFIGAQDYANAHNETILPKMMELLPLEEMGVQFIKMSGKITHKIKFPEPYNFSIKFISYDQEEHKQEGPTWNGGWFDEPPPRGIYVACRRGCMKHAAPILFTATPLREPWMYDEIYTSPKAVHVDKKEDIKNLRWDTPAIIHIGRNDNPYISEEQLKSYEDSLDEEEKAARIYGEFMHLQGRVYKQFDRSKHVIDRETWFTANPTWRKYPGFCILDPHDRKPWALGWGVVTPRDELVWIDEWPNFDFARQKTWKFSIDEYVDLINQREQDLWKTRTEGSAAGLIEESKPGISWRIMDPNFGRTPRAGIGRTLEDELADHGLFFETQVDDDVDQGHMVVKSDLHTGRVFWLSGLNNFFKSMENYTWDDYRGKSDRAPKETPKDNFKDFADLVRYACKSDLHYIPPGATEQKNPWAA